MRLETIQNILSLRGTPVLFKENYRRFKADNGREYKRNETFEYLHYVGVVKDARVNPDAAGHERFWWSCSLGSSGKV